MVLGLILWGQIAGPLMIERRIGTLFIAVMFAGLVVSPIAGLVLSWPFRRPGSSQAQDSGKPSHSLGNKV